MYIEIGFVVFTSSCLVVFITTSVLVEARGVCHQSEAALLLRRRRGGVGEEGPMYNEMSSIFFVKGVDGAARCTWQNELARSSVQQTRLLALSNPKKSAGAGAFPPLHPPPPLGRSFLACSLGSRGCAACGCAATFCGPVRQRRP
jgi:hypothetical protein